MDIRWKKVEELCQNNQKISAIKLLREITGGGLKEAKEDVEYFIAHGRWETSLSDDSLPAKPGRASLDTEFSLENLRRVEKICLQENSKIAAIKLFRQQSGSSLREAKEAVEYFIQHRKWPEKYDRLVAQEKAENQEVQRTSVGDDVLGLRIDIVAQQGMNSPVSTNAPSQENGPRKALEQHLGKSPRVLMTLSASWQLDTGAVLLTSDAIFFCTQRFDDWTVTDSWAISQLEKYDVNSSFMGAELRFLFSSREVHFSNLDIEEGRQCIALVQSLLQPIEETDTSSHSVVYERDETDPSTMDHGFDKKEFERDKSNGVALLLVVGIAMSIIGLALSFLFRVR